jgi:pyruvate-ferredoxin/flavodoxin oxidoreductase
MVRDVKPGGTFLMNCQWTRGAGASSAAAAKRYIAKNNIQLYTIDAIDLARQIGMGKRTNTILQSAFFALAGVLPEDDALKYMKDAATKSYLKKGQDVVDMNHKAIDAGRHRLPQGRGSRRLGQRPDEPEKLEGKPELREDGQGHHAARSKDGRRQLPVSAFVPHADGTFELGAAAYEKRGVAVMVPSGTRQVPPVQQLRLCLPPRHHPSLRADDRGGGQAAPAAAKIVRVKSGKGKGV